MQEIIAYMMAFKDDALVLQEAFKALSLISQGHEDFQEEAGEFGALFVTQEAMRMHRRPDVLGYSCQALYYLLKEHPGNVQRALAIGLREDLESATAFPDAAVQKVAREALSWLPPPPRAAATAPSAKITGSFSPY